MLVRVSASGQLQHVFYNVLSIGYTCSRALLSMHHRLTSPWPQHVQLFQHAHHGLRLTITTSGHMHLLGMRDHVTSPAPKKILNLLCYTHAFDPSNQLTYPDQSPRANEPMLHHRSNDGGSDYGFGKQRTDWQRVRLEVVVKSVDGTPSRPLRSSGIDGVVVS